MDPYACSMHPKSMQLTKKLKEWIDVSVTHVERRKLKVDPSLQPRDPAATRRSDAWFEQRESKRHIEDLTRVLANDSAKELDAPLVADVSGTLFVVDGHHRHEAYSRAARFYVSVRVKKMTMRKAQRLASVANLEGRSLALTNGQKQQAAWQYLIDVTNGGRKSLREAGTNQREIADLFHIGSKTTIGNMTNRLELAGQLRKGKTIPLEGRDSKGWPTWRSMKHHLMPADVELTFDEYSDAKVLDMAAKLARWSERHSLARVKAAFRLMLQDAGEDAAELIEGSSDF